MANKSRVLVWGEFRHEKTNPKVAALYPEGMHETIAARIWTIAPHHPIAAGIPDHFEIPTEEMYGEPFGIPQPDELIFISWFTGGEVFRSGATWQRGNGRVYYFRPGHETYPTYHHPQVQRVIANAVRWARPTVRIPDNCPNTEPLEPLPHDPEAAERPKEGFR